MPPVVRRPLRRQVRAQVSNGRLRRRPRRTPPSAPHHIHSNKRISSLTSDIRSNDRLSQLSDADFKRVAKGAGAFVNLVAEAFEQNSPVIPELLGDGEFLQWSHYPPDDYYDERSGVLAFYHAHSPEDRRDEEHGHFHCFVECSILSETPPVARPRKRSGRRLCHLVAISVDMAGVPRRLFAPNQWVTGEWLYPVDRCASLLERFSQLPRTAPRPFRWAANLVTMFEPQIIDLLGERDHALGRGRPAGRRARDETLDIVCSLPLDIDLQLAAIAKDRRRRSIQRRGAQRCLAKPAR
jgi:hypothetical protein